MQKSDYILLLKNTIKEKNINFLQVLQKFLIDLFIKIIVPYLQHFIPLLCADILIFIVTIAVVFAVGRMLLLTKSDRLKNSFALITLLGLNWYINLYQAHTIINVTDMVIHSSIGILLYVLIGFKLYDRVDSFLDKHFGKDKIRRKK